MVARRSAAKALTALCLMGCSGEDRGDAAPASGGVGGGDASTVTSGGGGTGATGGEVGSVDAALFPPCAAGEVSCNQGCLAQPGDEHAGCTAVHFAESAISSLAIDDTALYFATNSHGIHKIDLAASTVTLVADGMSLPQNLVLGTDDIYYATYASDGTIERVPKSGGTPIQLALGVEWVGDLALAGDTLYVLSSGGLDPMMRMLPVTGGTPTPFGTTSIQSFLIDGSMIYYVAQGTSIFGSLTASPIADPAQATVLATSVFANRLASDTDAIYWITSTDHSGGRTDHVYYRASKTGSTSERLMEGDLQWEIVHQDAAIVYVRQQYAFEQPGDADEQVRLLRMPIAAPTSDIFATVEHTSIQAIVTDNSTVYIAAGRAIVKLQK